MSMLGTGVVTLSGGAARCEIAPHAGGAVAGFWWEEKGRRIDWLRPATSADVARGDASRMGCFPMVPYSSRIRDGRFTFCGHDVVETPAKAMRHAMHGHGWRRDWSVVSKREHELVLEYTHHPDAWPWQYRARQTFVLAGQALSITLEIENQSEALMPAGLGFHPFFPAAGEATITAHTAGVWLTDAEVMPTERTSVPPGWDLSLGRSVAELALDNVFTGWSGDAMLSWPKRGARLALGATQPLLSFLAVYTPRDEDFFCVEPASHCTDAINLAREGVAETGLRVLAPGAARSAQFILRPEFA
jgi:aldose 1-epimerase